MVPLFIPTYPPPAIFAAWCSTASIFSATLGSDVAGYQTHDKATLT